MAARLTVIVSQSAVRDSAVADLEETLVAELIMLHGLDANLVGALENMQPDSTDWLCVSGFRGSLAVVSWLSTEELSAAWQRLELGGQVRRLGTPASEARVRSVIHFPIHHETKIADLTQQLKTLQDDQGVKTVGIALAGTPGAKPQATSQNSGKPQPMEAQDKPPSRMPERIIRDSAEVRTADRSKSEESGGLDDSGDDEATQWPNLDQLVDDFDALDI